MRFRFSIFFIFSCLSLHCQVIEELRVTFSDGLLDTFKVMTGNLGMAQSLEMFDKSIAEVVDVNGSTLVCDSIALDLAGKIALVDFGICNFQKKFDNVVLTDAIGLIICNTFNGEGQSIGNINGPDLPVGTMFLSDCEEFRLKLDDETKVDWVSIYDRDCSDLDNTNVDLCNEAWDLGVIMECPLNFSNAAEFATYNLCPTLVPAATCYANKYGSKWVKFSTGSQMGSFS